MPFPPRVSGYTGAPSRGESVGDGRVLAANGDSDPEAGSQEDPALPPPGAAAPGTV